MPFHAGLDWGVSHALCVIDGVGQVIVRLDVRHDAAGLADMVARLKRVAAPAELPIAIERPSGLVVDTLVEAGYRVIPIHPNVVKACRPRYRAVGGKSDPGDAFMLADILRTDGHRFRQFLPVSDDIRALRALVRGRDDLVAQRVALANQLRNLLEGFWPGAVAIFAAIDSPIALAFVGRYPTPDSASRLGEKRLACFMAQHAYCGRRSPADLLARLRAAPTGLAGDAETDAKGELAGALVAILERLVCEIAKLSSHIEHAVAQ
ncbi:IS110 family transposase [Mesorhizobium sp. M0130]|uniref:IS110 family transposase n=1 Tax=Mesorhizobium sp. M0130 TaxID=2956887 RepID=UPI003336D12D